MKVGEHYSAASRTYAIGREIGDTHLEITINLWEEQDEECVTQRITPPTNYEYGQATLFEWIARTTTIASALTDEGFYITDGWENAVIWSRKKRRKL